LYSPDLKSRQNNPAARQNIQGRQAKILLRHEFFGASDWQKPLVWPGVDFLLIVFNCLRRWYYGLAIANTT